VTPALIFAFTAGAVATINPCGWALLPAWFARRMNDAGDTAPVFAALRAGVLATVGFVVIFGLAGAALALGAAWLGPVLPYVGLAVGGVLAVVGFNALFANKWRALPGGDVCQRVSDRHGSLVFGIGYGLVSLSCTLPIFLAAIGFSLTGTPVDLAVNMLAYALGMGTVLSALGIVAATTGAGFSGLSPRGHVVLKKLSAVLLLIAAAYVLFYWGRVTFGDVMVENAIINMGDSISGGLRYWLAYGAGRWVLGGALGLLIWVSVVGFITSRQRSHDTDKEATGSGKRI
jgi:cytochrome c-type biogenesis protein